MLVIYSLTSAINKDGCRLVEARVEVSLEWGNVLGEVNELVQECPNIDESCIVHTIMITTIVWYTMSPPAVVIATEFTV